MPNSRLSVISIGALVTGATRGLVADINAVNALGANGFAVCSAIVIASHDHVTDVTEVPSDTVGAQLVHLQATTSANAMLIGVLGEHKTAEAVMDFAHDFSGPAVLDLTISGPSGETVLTKRGTEAVLERLAVPDLVSIGRKDAELVTGGEIQSLDDAQVAVQRLHNRGAQRVLIRCGALPTRFFDAHDDPGGDQIPAAFMTDLYFDGEEFSLFEAPLVPMLNVCGASSALHMGILSSLVGGSGFEEAIQRGKKFATDSIRHANSGDNLAFSEASLID